MGRIIVPLDGSVRGEQALSVAEAIAQALEEPLELFQVVPALDYGLDREESGEHCELATMYLESVAKHLPSGLSTSTRVNIGDPGEEILQLAEQQVGGGYTLIVMATHGRGGVDRAVIGSVADHVARHAQVPVVLVRAPVQGLPSIQRLLVPLDGSDLAEQALPLAVELARRTRATIHLVRVVPPFKFPTAGLAPEGYYVPPETVEEIQRESITEARAYIDHVGQTLRRQRVLVSWEVRTGQVVPEILRTVATIGPNLVVMSSHGRSGLRRLALGSVADDFIRSGEVPVVIVPHGTAPEPVPGLRDELAPAPAPPELPPAPALS